MKLFSIRAMAAIACASLRFLSAAQDTVGTTVPPKSMPPKAETPKAAKGWICAEGGGNANKGNWSDEVFGWMVEKSGKGAVAVIGAVPIEGDERIALFTKLGASSVISLVIDEKNADTPEIGDAIAKCKLIFIRGGDQSRYVNWWKGTATQRAIIGVFEKGGVVGGTSAGCAVLGELVYDARHGGLSPRDALADARHPDLTLTHDFLSFVPDVLFDTHFTERGRLPRLVVMLAREQVDTGRAFVGLGVDPRTAVCVGPDGIAEVRGEGTVTMLRLPALPKPGTPDEVQVAAGKPPRILRVGYTQMTSGYRFVAGSGEIVERPKWVRERMKEAERKPDSAGAGGKGGQQPVLPEVLRSLKDSVSRNNIEGLKLALFEVWRGEDISDMLRGGQLWIAESTDHRSVCWHIGTQDAPELYSGKVCASVHLEVSRVGQSWVSPPAAGDGDAGGLAVIEGAVLSVLAAEKSPNK